MKHIDLLNNILGNLLSMPFDCLKMQISDTVYCLCSIQMGIHTKTVHDNSRYIRGERKHIVLMMAVSTERHLKVYHLFYRFHFP